MAKDMLAIFGYVLIGGLFFNGILSIISTNSLRRQRLFNLHSALMVMWFGILLFLELSEECTPLCKEEYIASSVAYASAWPIIIGSLINRCHIRQPAIMRLKRTRFKFAIDILSIAGMVQLNLYAMDYYKNDFYSYASLVIPMTIAIIILAIGNTVIYKNGILAAGTFFFSWTDFKSYRWVNNKLKLLLIKKYLFFKNLNIDVHPMDKDAMNILLSEMRLCDTFNTNEGEVKASP